MSMLHRQHSVGLERFVMCGQVTQVMGSGVEAPPLLYLERAQYDARRQLRVCNVCLEVPMLELCKGGYLADVWAGRHQLFQGSRAEDAYPAGQRCISGSYASEETCQIPLPVLLVSSGAAVPVLLAPVPKLSFRTG